MLLILRPVQNVRCRNDVLGIKASVQRHFDQAIGENDGNHLILTMHMNPRRRSTEVQASVETTLAEVNEKG